MAPDLDPLAESGVDDAPAVKSRFNPWWLFGAVLLVLAVVLGVRQMRKRDDVADPLAFDGFEPPELPAP